MFIFNHIFLLSRFNNYPWGAFSTISYWFKVEGGARKQGLLNNGNCKEVPTIQMYSEGSSLRGQILVTNNETLVTITLREKLVSHTGDLCTQMEVDRLSICL